MRISPQYRLTVAVLAAITVSACDFVQKKESPRAAVIAQARKTVRHNACASRATYDRLIKHVFDEAIRIRNADPINLATLAAYSVVRMEAPLVKSHDDSLDVTVCSGRFIVELPPGAERGFGGERRLVADIEYAAQPAADGSGLIYTMRGAEPIVYKLAAFDLKADYDVPQTGPRSARMAWVRDGELPTPASDLNGEGLPVTAVPAAYETPAKQLDRTRPSTIESAPIPQMTKPRPTVPAPKSEAKMLRQAEARPKVQAKEMASRETPGKDKLAKEKLNRQARSELKSMPKSEHQATAAAKTKPKPVGQAATVPKSQGKPLRQADSSQKAKGKPVRQAEATVKSKGKTARQTEMVSKLKTRQVREAKVAPKSNAKLVRQAAVAAKTKAKAAHYVRAEQSAKARPLRLAKAPPKPKLVPDRQAAATPNRVARVKIAQVAPRPNKSRIREIEAALASYTAKQKPAPVRQARLKPKAPYIPESEAVVAEVSPKPKPKASPVQVAQAAPRPKIPAMRSLATSKPSPVRVQQAALAARPAVVSVRGNPGSPCRSTQSRSDYLICSDQNLSALDRRMSSLFSAAMSDADSWTRTELSRTRGRFVAWLHRCQNQSCIANAYSDRIDEIRDIMKDARY